VDAGIKLAQMRGISGVPFTIFGGKLAISGAQETEAFYDVFLQIASGELKI
jgi:predicted DsbA family dithiol-disulfide isomerase